jgi:hypothetical protein
MMVQLHPGMSLRSISSYDVVSLRDNVSQKEDEPNVTRAQGDKHIQVDPEGVTDRSREWSEVTYRSQTSPMSSKRS